MGVRLQNELDATWQAWLSDHPGYVVDGLVEHGDRGHQFLPVRFDPVGWWGWLVRDREGQIVVVWGG